jgi:hypothetical protein
MAEERVVAVISPWEKISEVVKKKFRIESLPREKKVIVWRDDLQDEQKLSEELAGIGIGSVEIRRRQPTDWQDVP